MTSFGQKGHHCEENPQSMTKMARNPQIWPISLSENSTKIRKIRNCDPNPISSAGGKDKSACKFSGHHLHVFLEKCTEPQTWPVSLSQKSAKMKKSTGRDYKLISSDGGQDTPAWKIWGHSLHAFSRKWPETPNLTYFTKSKWRQKEDNQQTVTII